MTTFIDSIKKFLLNLNSKNKYLNIELTKEDRNIFFVSFFVGIITHFQMLVNNLYMTDYLDFNVTRISDRLFYGAGTISGRWLIELLNILMNSLGYTIKIPSFCVLMAIIILSISNVILIRLIDVDNKIIKYLILVSTMVSPSLVNANYFTFTTHMFALSILLITISIYNIMKYDNIIVGTFFITFAIAIYQAYVSYILSLYIVCFYQYILKHNFNENIKKLFTCMFSFVFSFLFYYIIMHILNHFFSNDLFIEFPQYGSISATNALSKFNFQSVIESIGICYTNFINLFGDGYEFAYNNTDYATKLNTIFLILVLIQFIIIFYNKLKNNKIDIMNFSFIIVLMILFPIATNFVFIMTLGNMPQTQSRVVYSYIFYMIFGLVIFDEFLTNFKLNSKKIVYTVSLIISCLILYDKLVIANNSYYNFKKMNDDAKSFSLNYAARLTATEGFDNDSKIIMVGRPQTKNSYYLQNSVPIFWETRDKDTLLYHVNNVQTVMNFFANTNFVYADDEYAMYLMYGRDVRNMPVYPAKDSIKKVEDYIIVKFDDIK